MKRLLITILMSIVLLGCINQENEIENRDEFPQEPMKGVSLSPRSFESEDFTRFFEIAQQAGKIISWAGDWNELTMENGGPRVVTELASVYDYVPLVIVQFFTQSTGKLIRPLSAENREKYTMSALSFVKTYHPQYFALGIEVNVLYEKSPQDFEDFVTFYSEVYDAIKKESPITKVFTIFQLERMKGLHGGLFGGENDPDNEQWTLLDKFPKVDIAAFTTYPGLIYKNPSDIPADYYTEISLYTRKPVAFTEIGWHSTAAIPGWESSEYEQREFVEIFFTLTKNMNIELMIWSFLYDQGISEPFWSMGFYDKDGNAKPAWDAWIKGTEIN
ncbi:MAG: hypothetical protein HXS44_16020 [Theionarchaea archaeon]|nr:hypothetical protein [Theionarchaea archaeon]